MAEQALSTIGVKFGWGLGTLTQAPTSFKEIEECISISSVELSKDQIDVTPLSAKRKRYIGGYEDSGGELETVFNCTDTFDAQWDEMLTAYAGRESGQSMWFCAWHPSRAKMSTYIVEPGSRPKPEYSTGTALQYTITNTLVDLPDDIAASEPTAALEPGK